MYDEPSVSECDLLQAAGFKQLPHPWNMGPRWLTPDGRQVSHTEALYEVSFTRSTTMEPNELTQDEKSQLRKLVGCPDDCDPCDPDHCDPKKMQSLDWISIFQKVQLALAFLQTLLNNLPKQGTPKQQH